MSEEDKDKESEVLNLKKERDEYLDGWRRAEANLINYKKEEARRLEEIAKFGSEDLICDFIPILDSFDLGIAAQEKKGEGDKGIYLIKSQLEDILRSRGLTKIKVSVGDKFNPTQHEIVGEVEGGESQTVAEEIAPGYTLHDKVIRPARVKVFK